jgi:AraC-like DNA-binding protein/quercetin dioxygenase-like cupin family protein
MADSFSPSAANLGMVGVRTGAPVSAGTLAYDADDLVTGWHHHDLHQLEYALEGVAEVETADGRFLLPPQQALWIPAGLEHNTTLRDVRTASVFFDPTMLPHGVLPRPGILAAAPVLREMIIYGLRWPVARAGADTSADAFFTALALVIADHLGRDVPLWLPTSADPLVTAAIAYTRAHLPTATAAEVSRALNVSERTLRRRFRDATGMTWHDFALRARVAQAMTALTSQDATVLDIAIAVGFQSPSAFNRAFRTLTGTTPGRYKRRSRGC